MTRVPADIHAETEAQYYESCDVNGLHPFCREFPSLSSFWCVFYFNIQYYLCVHEKWKSRIKNGENSYSKVG